MNEHLARFDQQVFALSPETRQRQSKTGTTVTVSLQHKPMPTHWGPLSNPSILVRFEGRDQTLVPRAVAQGQADEAVRCWLGLDRALPLESARVRVVADDGGTGFSLSAADIATLLQLLRDWPAL